LFILKFTKGNSNKVTPSPLIIYSTVMDLTLIVLYLL